MQNKENTGYYFLGAILAYYLYMQWKNKQNTMVPGNTNTIVQSLQMPLTSTPILKAATSIAPGQMVQSLTALQPMTSSNALMPNTYQTFYGQLKGVPKTC
jgi:hypothetical protein